MEGTESVSWKKVKRKREKTEPVFDNTEDGLR